MLQGDAKLGCECLSRPEAPAMGSPLDRLTVFVELASAGLIEGEIIRHLAPRTCDAILNTLPVEARMYKWEDQFLYFDIPVSHGLERPQKAFRAGDISFWPLKSAICLHLVAGITYSQMNPVGRISSGLEGLSGVESGTNVVFRRGGGPARP